MAEVEEPIEKTDELALIEVTDDEKDKTNSVEEFEDKPLSENEKKNEEDFIAIQMDLERQIEEIKRQIEEQNEQTRNSVVTEALML